MRRTALALCCVGTAGTVISWSLDPSCERHDADGPPDRTERRLLRSPLESSSIFDYDAPIDGGTMFAGEEQDAGAAGPDEGILSPDVERALCEPLADAMCRRRARCGCEVEPDCVRGQLGACRDWLRYIFGNGRRDLLLDPEGLAACIATMNDCKALPLVDRCAVPLLDPAIPGEPCSGGSSNCVGGRCRDFECTAYARAGEPCGVGCAPGLDCEDDVCREGARPCGPHHPCADPLERCHRGHCIAGIVPCGNEEEGDGCELGPVCEQGRCALRVPCTHAGECSEIDHCASGFRGYVCAPDLCRYDPLWMIAPD
jgi:hypothetical protein